MPAIILKEKTYKELVDLLDEIELKIKRKFSFDEAINLLIKFYRKYRNIVKNLYIAEKDKYWIKTSYP
ncbi:MAG: hypothetical protein ACTSXW_01670 [Candidatus Baldrarchaeia archaeon]